MNRSELIEKYADLIQSEVGYFNGWGVDDEEEREACTKAATAIAELQSDGWVSVEDRLPELTEMVITYPYSAVTVRHYKDGAWFFDALPVTHWQPLPAPPRGE